MIHILGKNTVLRDGSVIGIFDLDNCSQSKITREFLSKAEKRGLVVNTAEDIPNSFLLCEDALYLVQASSKKTAKKLETRNGELYGGNHG